MRSDEDLMRDVCEGDTGAFATLVRRHRPRALRIARSLLGDSSRAEEAAQQAFVKIFEARKRYEPTAAFTTYLHTVVSRLCFDWSRTKRPHSRDPVEGFGAAPSPPSPLDQLLEKERREALCEALEDLPDRQRRALILQHREDQSYRQIARDMEITTKAVERLLARARSALRSALAGRVDVPRGDQ